MQAPFLYFSFENQPLLFQNPLEIIVAHHVDEVLPAIEQIEQHVDQGYYAAGYLAYEAAPAFDPKLRVRSDVQMPLLWFGIFGAPLAKRIDYPTGNYHLSSWRVGHAESDHREGIAKIHAHIARGETYQVNYTMRLTAAFSGDDLAYYHRLIQAQQANYAVYGQLGRYRILSASPELFFRFDKQQIWTRPMKGTSKRGLSAEEDQRLKHQLCHSEKERAENWMIVDLLRNDLSRVAIPGSVQVSDLLTVEQYPTVWQLTSAVSAQRTVGVGWKEMLAALFPCGSITGAPKIKTMDIIATLESTPREIYCGTIGYLSPTGNGVFNVPIRTVWIDTIKHTATYGVGGGITWDSTAQGEYLEVIHKAAYLEEELPNFSLLESLLLQDGAYQLLPEHRERLSASASYFQFPYPSDAIDEQLRLFASSKPTGKWKVRLLLTAQGQVIVEGTPIEPIVTKQRVVWAERSIDRKHRYLYHKTTFRQIYEQVGTKPADAFDLLLWNDQDECTEFTIGNLVIELDGVKYTPPVNCGLLPGTFRQSLLAQGVLKERIIKKEELTKASRIWLINSVRGWVEVGFDTISDNLLTQSRTNS